MVQTIHEIKQLRTNVQEGQNMFALSDLRCAELILRFLVIIMATITLTLVSRCTYKKS